MVDANVALLIGALSSLLTIVNPFSTASIFVTVTANNTKAEKKVIAKKACYTAAIVLVIMGIAGSTILSFFSITIEAFRIAGGILIAGVGMQMLHAKSQSFKTDKEKKEAVQKEDPSIIPLAIPFLSGPGAITTAIVLMGSSTSVVDKGFVLIACIVVAIISYFVLVNADSIVKFLGSTGKNVVDKIMGLIVLVVGVQFIINGIHGLIVAWF